MSRRWLFTIAAAGVVGGLIAVPGPVPAEKKAADKDMKSARRLQSRRDSVAEKTQAQDGSQRRVDSIRQR